MQTRDDLEVTINSLLREIEASGLLKLIDCSNCCDYEPMVRLLPRRHWPKAEEVSLSDARVLPIIYHVYAPPGTELYGIVRGMATVGLVIADDYRQLFQRIVSAVSEELSKDGSSLPPIDCKLSDSMREGALHIVTNCEPISLRDMLAWNYGLHFAASIAMPGSLLGCYSFTRWLRRVVRHFGGMGIVPS